MISIFGNKRIAVLGAGSWGITLANYCRDIGRRVKLWEFDSHEAERLRQERKRETMLPGIKIHTDIVITSDIDEAIRRVEMILLVVPSHIVRGVIRQLAGVKFHKNTVLISCTKGIENDTQMTISQIVHEELTDFNTDHFAVLSGPSHAEEVCQKIPTAVVIASKSRKVASYLQRSLASTTFRLYSSHDVIGVELGGALKNVIAIAAGICDGAGFGDNTKSALQPRGLAEIIRLGRKLKADPMTFAGLSGMGDLIVTCMSRHSRNRYLGEQIGKGKKLSEVLEEMSMVAEGVRTCKSAVALSKLHKVEMPICEQVYHVLFSNRSPRKALKELMNREIKPEIWY